MAGVVAEFGGTIPRIAEPEVGGDVVAGVAGGEGVGEIGAEEEPVVVVGRDGGESEAGGEAGEGRAGSLAERLGMSSNSDSSRVLWGFLDVGGFCLDGSDGVFSGFVFSLPSSRKDCRTAARRRYSVIFSTMSFLKSGSFSTIQADLNFCKERE